MDKTSLTLGWLVGKQIAGQRKAVEKQPVAYLYNGVTAKDINEVWTDKKTYPYAFLARLGTSSTIRLYLTTSLCCARFEDGELHGFYVDEDCTMMVYNQASSDFSWYFFKKTTYKAKQVDTTMNPLWTSEDMKRVNYLGWSYEISDYAYELTEEIALPTSKPIPVFE